MTPWLELPKVELHCHLLGVINPDLLRRIQLEGGEILIDPDTLGSAYPVLGLDSFQRWVDLLKPYQCATPELMRPILAAHVAALIAQNVVYAEIMISPAMFPRGIPSLLDAFRRWRDWAYELEEGKIQIEFILVLPRSLGPEALLLDTANFLALRRANLIAGVALVGVESGESIGPFRGAFAQFREAGLGIEIHAGEHTGPKSIWDALEHGCPDRLGHALSAFQDNLLLEHIRAHSIHVEFCPTSNLRTGAIASMQEHPIGRARELCLNFGLNTDDPGAFGCSMESEYEVAAGTHGFAQNDFAGVFRRSLEARFEPKLRYLDMNANQNNYADTDY